MQDNISQACDYVFLHNLEHRWLASWLCKGYVLEVCLHGAAHTLLSTPSDVVINNRKRRRELIVLKIPSDYMKDNIVKWLCVLSGSLTCRSVLPIEKREPRKNSRKLSLLCEDLLLGFVKRQISWTDFTTSKYHLWSHQMWVVFFFSLSPLIVRWYEI